MEDLNYYFFYFNVQILLIKNSLKKKEDNFFLEC